MNYEQFNKARVELANIAEQQRQILLESDYDSIVKTNVVPTENLEACIKSLNGDLNTLVMGRFSSGKSVFLNAFLGAALLPVDVRPCTAVIGEIVYGNEWKFTLHPKDKAKSAFSISREQLSEYITIPHGGENKENPYSRLIINAPLPICKNGIRMIDSPGLDDPTSHDEVTKAYLPQADAIIYCMPCTQAYSNVDKITIDELRALGYTNIIFVLTFIDRLEMDDRDFGENSADTCREHYTELLAPLTDLGKDGIFFVNSRGALKGKIDNKPELLKKSHFDVVEKKVEEILVEEKGNMKLKKLYAETSSLNRENSRALIELCKMHERNREKLEEQVKNAKIPYEAAKEELQFIKKRINFHRDSLCEAARREAEIFYDKILDKIPCWANDASTETSFANPLKLKENIKSFASEVINGIKHSMEDDISKWSTNTLGTVVTKGIERLQNDVEHNITQCLKEIEKVKIRMDVNAAEIADNEEPSTANRIISGGAALLLGDLYGAIGGGVGGYKMMLRTIAAEIVGVCVLLVINMFTPIGLPALIISGILSVFAGGTWNMLSISGNIRKKVAEKMREELSKPAKKQDMIDNICAQISGIMVKISNNVDSKLSGSLNATDHLLQQATEKLNGQGKEEKNLVLRYQGLIERSEKLRNRMDAFIQNYL